MRLDSMTIPSSSVEVIFSHFPRKTLRKTARQNGIPVGRNKSDTIRHLVQAHLPLDVNIPTLPLWKDKPTH